MFDKKVLTDSEKKKRKFMALHHVSGVIYMTVHLPQPYCNSNGVYSLGQFLSEMTQLNIPSPDKRGDMFYFIKNVECEVRKDNRVPPSKDSIWFFPPGPEGSYFCQRSCKSVLLHVLLQDRRLGVETEYFKCPVCETYYPAVDGRPLFYRVVGKSPGVSDHKQLKAMAGETRETGETREIAVYPKSGPVVNYEMPEDDDLIVAFSPTAARMAKQVSWPGRHRKKSSLQAAAKENSERWGRSGWPGQRR